MAISDWFKKAKEAKKEKVKKEKLPDLGFMGKNASNKAYRDAQIALQENDQDADDK